ncbi:copper-containing nitrite reductase [Halorubrum halophilum]|uniref:copper-containing nitrite reductase n=1 Tax=Halorubrum halophilum TaxID=413816 RepID=UPI0006797B55|nr:copper-containing nitrite reductase [Halorubrum halophilum]
MALLPNIERRSFLKVAGLGGAAALAGCTEDSANAASTTAAQTSDESGAASVDVDRVAADPTDVPDPVDWNQPRTHDITMETKEVTAEIEPGVTFDYMTFDGRVPGPMVRVRRGDTVNLTLQNPEDSDMPHNIDFHAVYGPGGGANATTIAPGEEATIEFKATYPGSHIYHCAVPNMDQHISAGMFGAILVEPKDGLPEVDKELYFGQHELYTDKETGEEGHHKWSVEAAKSEDPTYMAFNGEAYAFTKDGYGRVPIEQGETVRVFLSNGGPNLSSSWHAIGNVWDRLYRDGDLVSDPARFVETTPVEPGTVTAAEIETPVPGPIKIVDHSLTRVARKGLLGVLDVQGEQNPEIYDPDPDGDSGGE